MSETERIIKLASRTEWDQARSADQFVGGENDTGGFIHLSSAAQLARTANKWFAGRADLLALEVDPKRLRSELKWEPNAQGELFPHIYGPINLDAVVAVVPLESGEDGSFTLPAAFQLP